MASSAMLTATAAETETSSAAGETATTTNITLVTATSAASLQDEDDDDCKDDDVLNRSLRSCANDPDFAVICAILQKFAKELGLDLPNFKRLQEWLTNTDDVAAQIRDLHIKLLRKTRKTVHEKSWESALSKFCFTYSAQDGWEVERFGYKQASLKVKLRILRELLESQFERNTKFRNKILTLSADSLRSQPIGRDRLGHSYWLTQDADCNLRIYQEHLDEEIWQVVATNRDEFVNLIARLRGNEVVLPATDIGVIDEDTSSSNSCLAPVEKPPPPEEKDDSQEEEVKVPNLRIKMSTDGSYQSGKDLGKGEEELAAEEDKKLEQKKLKTVTGVVEQDDGSDDDGEEDEEEEAEEEEEDSGEEEQSEYEATPVVKIADKNKTVAPAVEAQKKVKPILISNAKIVSSANAVNATSTNGAAKKRFHDEMDKTSPRSDDNNINTIKKFRPSLLDSKREKKPSKYEKAKSEDEDDEDDDDESEDSEEEDEADIDDVEDECEEEDIDSAAAEEDENEEKDIEDDDYDDLEVGEAIEDPPIRVFGEGSGKQCDGANPEFSSEFLLIEENCFLLAQDEDSEPEVGEAIEEEYLYISGEGYGAECLVGNKNNDGEEPITPTTTTRINEPKATFFFGEPGCLKLSPIKNSSTSTDVDPRKNDEENTVQVKDESSANCKEVESGGEQLKEETFKLEIADKDNKNNGNNEKEQNVETIMKKVEEKTEGNNEENNKKYNQPHEEKHAENVNKNDCQDKKLSDEKDLTVERQNTPEYSSNDIAKDKNGENNVQKKNLRIHQIQELESNNRNVENLEEKVAGGQLKEESIENVAFNGGEVNNETTNKSQEQLNKEPEHSDITTQIIAEEEPKLELVNQSEKRMHNEAEKDNLQNPTSTQMQHYPIKIATKPEEKAVERFSPKLVEISKEKSSIPFKVNLENNALLKVEDKPDQEISLNINVNKNESIPEIKKEQIISLNLKKETQKIQESSQIVEIQDKGSEHKASCDMRKPQQTTSTVDQKNEKKSITSNVKKKVDGISKIISLKDVNDEMENKITPKDQEKGEEKSSLNVVKVASEQAGDKLENNASHNVEKVKNVEKSSSDVEKSSSDVEEKPEPGSSKILGITLKKNLIAHSENKAKQETSLNVSKKLSHNADGPTEKLVSPNIEKNSNQKPTSSSENKTSNINLTKQHYSKSVKTTESSIPEVQHAAGDNISLKPSSPSKPLITETQKAPTTVSLPNRKRRLAEFEVEEPTKTCQLTTSESELDFQLDNTAEPPKVAADDIAYDMGNVGGKRLKMRGKLTNSEIRKKVEAQKIAAVEETTSSSGEEEALRKRKIISPKRQLLGNKITKTEVQKKSDCSALTEVKEVATKLSPSLLKQKQTLAEIVEKKLKKTAEKPVANLVVSACTSQEAAADLTNTKKASIIKPLKKNLLTQLRQEESDEETIPRKRTTSETVHYSLQEASAKLVTIAPKKEEKETTRARPDRKTPDRQRKRRNSQEVQQTELPDHKIPQTSECVGEKLKKNDADVVTEAPENEKPRKDLPSIVKRMETTKEEELSSQHKPAPSFKTKSLDVNPVFPIAEDIKPVKKEEWLTAIVEPIKPVIKEEITTPTTVGRRSGRRGGATVIYAELPQPKRTRGGIAKAAATVAKSKKEDAPEKMDESQTKPIQEATEIKKSCVKEIASSAKESFTKSDTPKETIKSSAAVTLEPKAAISASFKEKEILKTSEEDDKNPSSPLKASASTSASKTASPMSTPNARGRVRKNRDVDTTNILELVDSETPVRQSRRIAQQKIREEAERRKLEEIALRTMKNELKKKKKAEAQADPTVPEPSDHSSSSYESDASEVEAEEAKKSKKKKCPGKDGTWSSGSEEQDEPEEEVEPPHYETDPGSPLFRSDHEFSPESDLEDESQVVPMKRARTARKEDADACEVHHQDQEACQKCGKSDHPEWILLCDSCDKGYHCSCLSPVLFYIPEGDWHCPPCQQEHLIAALEKQLKDFDDLVEQKRLEQEQAQRLAQEAERLEKQRQEEEKRKKKNKKQRGDNESSENEDDEKSNAAKVSAKESGDDDEDKSVKKDKKAKKNQSSDKRKQRHETGGSRRRRRKAATRGARRRRRNETSGSADSDDSSGSSSRSGSDSGSGSSSSSSSSATDSDDEPIYKLRKRRQINVSYRLNEYDDLINSALKKEMDGAAGAGNLGRGKDITTIIEADKEEQARQKNVEDDEGIKLDEYAVKKENEELTMNQQETAKTENADEPEKKNANKEDDSEEEPLQRKAITKTLKKKPRKLTTLDISSEEDNASDEDFKGSSLDDDDEDTSVSVSSNSDSSLEIYRRRNKKGKKKTRKVARRAARERRKVKKFVVDDSDDEEEEVARPKTKKKRKTDSDYTESEEDDENSELSENMDSADLCDDSSSSEGSDGAWCPSKRKKKRKANVPIARKSPKLKKPLIKKPKRVEYSDDDISEEEEDDYDDDDDLATGGKGSGKQPRSVPLKKHNSGKGKGKGGAGSGKSSKAGTASKKKKNNLSDYDDESLSESDDSTRKTRGRRYAYLEDFEDDSSDGGIKPGVQRPDTPPEEREKFIKKQEEIKRMLAEKNAEGAKLAATPRLTPIKGGTRSPAKPGDSLSTVPLSVIRQAKVLDIDYLQRKGESVSDVDNVDDVDSEFDDADLPDDFPEDMDEDAIARMVEEEEEFGAANATRELPAPDEVLKPTAAKAKPRESEKPVTNQAPNPSLPAMSHMPTTAPVGPSASASGLQEPLRKRLPMPTMHPPLLRHQYPGGGHHQIPTHMMQRHAGPPTHLLQNALSAPLGQPMHRHFPHQAPGTQRGTPGGGMPPRHALPPHTLPPPQQQLAASHSLHGATGLAAATEPKPRGRRKKITPLRDPLQKQQAAAAATAAAAVQAATTVSGSGKTESISTTAVATGVIKNSTSLAIAQPPQLYKPPGGGGVAARQVQPSVITRMPHMPPHSGPPGRGMSHGPPGLYAGGDARFYGPPMQQPSVGAHGSRLPPAGSQRHRGPPHGSGMPPHHSMRPSYGPPPPLRGVVGSPNQHQPSSVSGTRAAYPPPPNHGDHRGQQPTGPYGPPPPARHAAPHMNPYRPSIFGNPNYAPRGAPPGANLRNSGPPGQDYTSGPPRSYAPYGYYPPPPPLTAAHPPAPNASHPPGPTTHTPNIKPSQPSTTHPPPSTTALPSAVPSSVIVSAPPSSHSLTSVATSAASALQKHAVPRVIPKSAPNAPSQTTSGVSDISSPSPSSVSSAPAKAHMAAVLVEPRKKLITLETFATSKSPLAISGESSGSRSSPNVQADGADDSTSRPAAATSAGDGQGASEFSGLVSYFSSQHDDYNT